MNILQVFFVFKDLDVKVFQALELDLTEFQRMKFLKFLETLRLTSNKL